MADLDTTAKVAADLRVVLAWLRHEHRRALTSEGEPDSNWLASTATENAITFIETTLARIPDAPDTPVSDAGQTCTRYWMDQAGRLGRDLYGLREAVEAAVNASEPQTPSTQYEEGLADGWARCAGAIDRALAAHPAPSEPEGDALRDEAEKDLEAWKRAAHYWKRNAEAASRPGAGGLREAALRILEEFDLPRGSYSQLEWAALEHLRFVLDIPLAEPEAPEPADARECAAEVDQADDGALRLTLDYPEGTHPAVKAWTALRSLVLMHAAIRSVEGGEAIKANLDEVKWTGLDVDAEPWWDLALKAYRFGRETEAPAAPSGDEWPEAEPEIVRDLDTPRAIHTELTRLAVQLTSDEPEGPHPARVGEHEAGIAVAMIADRIDPAPSPWRPISEAAERFGYMVEFNAALRVTLRKGLPDERTIWEIHVIELDDETGQISLANRDDCGWTLDDFELCAPIPALTEPPEVGL